jgi:hypothetical protein
MKQPPKLMDEVGLLLALVVSSWDLVGRRPKSEGRTARHLPVLGANQSPTICNRVQRVTNSVQQQQR